MSNESLKAKLEKYNAEYAAQTAKHPERVGLKHKNLYTPLDIEGFDYERDLGFPGEYPYTRGVQRPCIAANSGPCVCTLASLPLKNPTNVIVT